MADEVTGTGGHSHAALQCAERESSAEICVQSGHGTHRSLASPLERRDIHHLPVGDPTAQFTRAGLKRDQAQNCLPPICLGGGGVWDADGGYSTHL